MPHLFGLANPTFGCADSHIGLPQIFCEDGHEPMPLALRTPGVFDARRGTDAEDVNLVVDQEGTQYPPRTLTCLKRYGLGDLCSTARRWNDEGHITLITPPHDEHDETALKW